MPISPVDVAITEDVCKKIMNLLADHKTPADIGITCLFVCAEMACESTGNEAATVFEEYAKSLRTRFRPVTLGDA